MPAGRLAKVVVWAGLPLAILSCPARSWAIEYLNAHAQSERDDPSICLTFSTPVSDSKDLDLKSYVRTDPSSDHSLERRGKDVCLGGLRHGRSYVVTTRAGLPAADGTTLAKDVTVEVEVPDRRKRVSFTRGKTLLPLRKDVGLPIRTVNVDKVHVVLYRINDRSLVDDVADEWFDAPLDYEGTSNVEDRSTKVFDGTLDVRSVLNEEVVTSIPIDKLIGKPRPGRYVAVATSGTDRLDRDGEKASQWFSVSDIGLASVRTTRGTLVVARSLKTALPMPNVQVKVVSRANEVLAAYRTDRTGRVMVPSGILEGEHGSAPRVIAACADDGGYSWLRVDAPSLDLSDMDVHGREIPQGDDAFLWTDRGVYRPGETIHLGVLLRGPDAAMPSGAAAVLHVDRPDGIEAEKRPMPLPNANGGSTDFHVADNAYSGSWTAWLEVGGKRVGSTSVSVQDFVPPRLEAKMTVPARIALDERGQVGVDVSADYFYGSPGADLSGGFEGKVEVDPTPFPAMADFEFGMTQDPFLAKALTSDGFTTDHAGKGHAVAKATASLDATHPLRATLRATVNDVDGRPAVAQATVGLRTADEYVGLRRDFGPLSDGDLASFDVAMVDGDGKPKAGRARWELVKEDYVYDWSFAGGRWQGRSTVIDTRSEGGDLALGADGRGKVSARVGNGRWRMEAYDPDGKAATSVRFGTGWWNAEDEGEDRKPGKLDVVLDKSPPLGKVRARVGTAFEGRMLVMLDGDGLHGVQEVEAAKGGVTVEFDGADVPPSGAYVVAMAVSPSGAVVPRLPVRAVGLAWTPGSVASHTLDVSLSAPASVRPSGKFDVDVAVAGAGEEDAYVTVAAVDEAVLRMTSFASPDPVSHYLSRRVPDMELRDVYGALIDPEGEPGRLREGGDKGNANLAAGLDVKTFRTVALFQGPVRVGRDGHAHLTFDVPDFSGKVRLMATAWTAGRFGAAAAAVTVRPALLAELTLPRFMAPGDRLTSRVMLTDLDAPEQDYEVSVSTTGPARMVRPNAVFEDVKRDRRRFVDRTVVAGDAPGKVRFHLAAKGADGTRAERDFDVEVRTPNAYATTRQVVELAPGASLSVDDALGSGFVPGTGKAEVVASSVPALPTSELLASLRRYPYGCAEQTVSRAFPEVLARGLGAMTARDEAGSLTGQDAIQRLASLQAPDGSFGYWSPFDTGHFWLTAYVVDYLQHAKSAGLQVPETMERTSLSWLAGRFGASDLKPSEATGAAYAAVVLSRAGRLDRSQARYVLDRIRGGMPTEPARFELAAALARTGDRDLSSGLVAMPPVRRAGNVWLDDYGSEVRDEAMALSLMVEEGLGSRKAIFERALDLSRKVASKPYLSTQEQSWLIRLASDFRGGTAPNVTVDGRPRATVDDQAKASMTFAPGRATTVANAGRGTVYVSVAATGIPAGAQPAEAKGYSVSRSLFHLDGTPVDPSDVHQNDEVVVVLAGKSLDQVRRKSLVVDMLPAGLEPETVGLTQDRDEGRFAWLKDLTAPTFFALRDDRYMAGVDLSLREDDTDVLDEFKFAYVARAVTPGTFADPGPQVEDMYEPAYHARGAAGTLEVKPARVAPARADDATP